MKPADVRRVGQYPVYLINLKHRQDRLAETLDQLGRCQWSQLFQPPQVVRAYHGWSLPLPAGSGGGMAGAWGCKRSHEECLRLSIEDGHDGAVILEDDFEVEEGRDFTGEMRRFMAEVPDDWDQMMPGYQAWNGEPTRVSPNVVKLPGSNRTQFYIVRDRDGANFRRELFRHFVAHVGGHCDHLLSALQRRFNCYAPVVQVCGQRTSFSDIEGRNHDSRHWIMPVAGRPVLVIHAPEGVILELQERRIINPVSYGGGFQPARVVEDIGRLNTQSTAAGTVTAVVHPDATAAALRTYTTDPVFSVTGATVAEVVERLPAVVRELVKL